MNSPDRLAPKAVRELASTRQFFERSTSVLLEADSNFTPKPELMTVAAVVAHVALTVEWFLDGVFSGKGFDMDFERHAHEATAFTSLEAARARLASAFDAAAERFGRASDEELLEPIPNDQIMGGAPRISAISGLTDHTAHHRGALTVYARLLGKVPPMPYM